MGKKIGKVVGFTLTEILVVVTILSIIIWFAMVYTAQFKVRQIGKEVATQTKQYASLFALYAYDMSESDLYQMRNPNSDICDRIDPFSATGSNTYVFSLANLQANNFGTKYDKKFDTYYCHPKQTNYWNDIYSQTNRYKQHPCLGIAKDAAGKYHGLLYWVNNPQSQQLPVPIARHASIALGDAGAYVHDGKIVGANWSVPLSDPRLNGKNCGGTLMENSIVYNLDMTAWMDELMPSGYIARESDLVHEAGTYANTNTAQTSIIMNGNSIVLDRGNNIAIKPTTNGVQLTGGTIQAEAISPQEAVDSGSACSSQELSTLKRQKDDSLRNIGGTIASEICSYSPVICRLYVNSDYCYLPTKKSTINYHPNTTSFICPREVPYLKSATAAYPDGSSANIQERGYQMSGYNIIRGANVMSSSNCLKWQFDVTAAYDYTSYFCRDRTETATCNAGEMFQFLQCNGRSVIISELNCDGMTNAKGARNWVCIQRRPNAVITSAVCSNKYFIDQQ